MTSKIFGYFGFENIDPAIVFIILLTLILILFIITIVQAVGLSKLKKTYARFMVGKNAKSMEHEIMALFKDIRFLKRETEKADADIKQIKRNLTFTYQKIGIVRYDAFREMGGRLSFSIAILNDRNDGYILNSVHSSDGCYSYVKEVYNGKSFLTLGEEEQEALDKALKYQIKAETGKLAEEDEDTVNEKNPFKMRDIEVDLEDVDLKELGYEEVR